MFCILFYGITACSNYAALQTLQSPIYVKYRLAPIKMVGDGFLKEGMVLEKSIKANFDLLPAYFT